ncbi:hypothetical protein Vadar_002510 [Vaccinium darrowii]|uniref:Uncharacterized protein n=1 Tax=Vaccinium darrowii TaxID=229202 RepID=A0ACB7X6U8_9ERIC|nr:hypothetical protein Vadar_002510 [Vaccinium darrowii]
MNGVREETVGPMDEADRVSTQISKDSTDSVALLKPYPSDKEAVLELVPWDAAALVLHICNFIQPNGLVLRWVSRVANKLHRGGRVVPDAEAAAAAEGAERSHHTVREQAKKKILSPVPPGGEFWDSSVSFSDVEENHHGDGFKWEINGYLLLVFTLLPTTAISPVLTINSFLLYFFPTPSLFSLSSKCHMGGACNKVEKQM